MSDSSQLQRSVSSHEPTTDSVWTPQRVDLVKRQVCPKGISDDEFAVFIAQCQRTGLDPLIREAFCTPRRENVGTRDNPRWIVKHVFVPGHDGMLARADRFPDFRGVRGAAVYEKDTLAIDEAEGIVRHTWSPIGDRGELVGAWAMALREGRRYPVEWVLLEEYRDERNPQWGTRPQTMIVKCARAAALRRAYPNAFGSIYIPEEMPQEAAQASRSQASHATVEAAAAAAVASGTVDVLPPAHSDTPALPPPADPVAVMLERIQAVSTIAQLRRLIKEITTAGLGADQRIREAYGRRQMELNKAGGVR